MYMKVIRTHVKQNIIKLLTFTKLFSKNYINVYKKHFVILYIDESCFFHLAVNKLLDKKSSSQ